MSMHMHEQKNETNLFPLTLEEFENIECDHTFSADYQQKKDSLLAAVRSHESQSSHRMAGTEKWRRLAAAACAALVLLPATAYAAERIYNSTIKKSNYQTQLHIEKNQDLEQTVKDVPVKLEATRLPEGSVPFQDIPGKYEVPADQGTDAHSVSLSLTKLDVDDWTFASTYTLDYEEFSAGEHQAFLIQRAAPIDEKGFDKEVHVIFEDYGYMATAYLGTGISADEAKEIAGGLTLTETEAENATVALSLKSWLADNAAKGTDASALSTQAQAADNSWYQIGDTITDDWGYKISVKDVQVMDNIRKLDQKYFQSSTVNALSELTDTSGNLTEHERKTIKYGDGVTSLDEVTETKNVKRKFVYLTLEITNPKDSKASSQDSEICTLYSMDYLKKGENGMESLDNFQSTDSLTSDEPVYFDGSETKNSDSHFFWASPANGETITCHLGYLVDEDLLPYMYINTSFDGAVNSLIDISQK